jgi:hypothetical protein
VPTNSGDFVSRADFDKLSRKLEALEDQTTKAGSRLAAVEEDVRNTKGDTTKILDLLMAEKKEQKTLPAPPKRKEIMPPPTEDLTSDSDEEDEIEYVPYGKGDQERLSAVPIWGKKKKSPPVACKGGSSAMSSSPSSSSSERQDLSRASGGGAMVVSSSSSALPSPSSLSNPKKEAALPSPSSLLGSRKESTSMSESGLVRCTDSGAFIDGLKSKGWKTLLALVQSKGEKPTDHLLTAAVNAVALSDESEGRAVAIASFDRARSMTAFDPRQRDCMRAAFNPKNPAFKQFCIRMADYCSRSPDKGIEFRRVKYPYAHLAQNDQHREELIAALRDN